MSRVSEADLEAPQAGCPICLATGPRRTVVCLQLDPVVNFVECANCGGVSADRFPTDDYLNRLYDPATYKAILVGEDKLTRRLAHRILGAMAIEPGTTTLSIVDYGGYDGRLAISLRDAIREVHPSIQVDCCVCDLYRHDSSFEIEFQSVNEFASLGRQFDVVLASAVIEHLKDIRDVTERLFTALKPGGMFYARSPYDAPLAQYVPGYSTNWPRHIHDLGYRRRLT